MMNRSGEWMGGTMLLRSHRVEVPAGTVTLQLSNAGAVPHEIVILPLPDGYQVGERSVGQDGAVDESDSLGEASQTGGLGPGESIDPGTTGGLRSTSRQAATRSPATSRITTRRACTRCSSSRKTKGRRPSHKYPPTAGAPTRLTA